MCRPRAVIFDIDGVIVDSESLYDLATHNSLECIGFYLDISGRARMAGRSLADCRIILESEFGASFPWQEFVSEYQSEILRLSPLFPPVKPGVENSLYRLRRAGLSVAFATNESYARSNEILRFHGLLRDDDILVAREQVELPKPEPDVYICAAQLLGEDISRLVAVEDSYVGLVSARRAGICAVLLPDFGPVSQESLEVASCVFLDIEAFVNVLLGDRPRRES